MAEGGTQNLSQAITFGYGSITAAPSNTQSTIGQAPACLDNSGATITSTACIVFNSRGVPINSTGSPTNGDALYVTNGQQVFAVTVSATGLVRLWQSPSSAAAWALR